MNIKALFCDVIGNDKLWFTNIFYILSKKLILVIDLKLLSIKLVIVFG